MFRYIRLISFTILIVCSAATGKAQIPSMDGLVYTDFASEGSQPEKNLTPWQRLDEPTRSFFERVLSAQLEHKGRENTDYDNVAHGNAPYVYGAWKYSNKGKDSWPQYYFNKGLSATGRRILLCIYAKLKAERLLPFIATFDRFSPDRPWPGFNVIINGSHEDFQNYLTALGYGNFYSAARKGRWGVRSEETGWQFHILGPKAEWDKRFIEIHIDANCPGRPDKKPARDIYLGLKHWWEDHETVTNERIADRLKAGLIGQGIFPPDVDEVRIGSCTTASLLKWKTNSPYAFGHIWLKPGSDEAGWWTESGGSKTFSRVERLSANSSVLTYRLDSHYGTLYLRVTSNKSMRATWHVKNENRTVKLEGELNSGHIYL